MIKGTKKLLVNAVTLCMALSEIAFIPQTTYAASYDYDSHDYSYDYDDYYDDDYDYDDDDYDDDDYDDDDYDDDDYDDYNDDDYDDDDYDDYNDDDYDNDNYENNDDYDNHTTTVTKTFRSKVTKKKIKKLCKELTNWAGVEIIYNIKAGKKYTYSMTRKVRSDIIRKNTQYEYACYLDYNDQRYIDEYTWNALSFQLFGKKTSNAQNPIVGDWGDGDSPVMKNIKIKKYKKNQYKVTTDIYSCYEYYTKMKKHKKEGNITIYLKKNKKSSYGVAITKIRLQKKK